MANKVFPSTIQSPSIFYDETPEDIGMVSQMEDGSSVSRAKFTKSRTTRNFHWNVMSDNEKDILFTFYKDECRGSAEIVSWGSLTGRISKLKAKRVSADSWFVEFTFEEA